MSTTAATETQASPDSPGGEPGRVASTGRRVVRVYAGLWGAAYDRTKATCTGSTRYVVGNVKRGGTKLKQTIGKSAPESQTGANADRADQVAGQPADDQTSGQADLTTMSEAQIEQQVVKVLERLGIPDRERLDELSQKIDALSAKIDRELHFWDRSASSM